MDEEKLKEIKEYCQAKSNVGLLYLFGSRATGQGGPLSDYDFAVFFCDSVSKLTTLKLELITSLQDILRTNNVDVVVLNQTISPELKYGAIREGKLIFEREPYRVLVEPKILNEYFDFRSSLLRFGLTSKVYGE